MRTLFIAAPAAFFLLTSNATAQTTDYPLAGPTAVPTVQVTAVPKVYSVSDGETEAISGAYSMSNGWRLKVEPARDGILAQIDKQHKMHLIALSADKFVTADGNVALEFNRGPDRDSMQMSYVPTSNIAEVIVIGSTLAKR
jgi:hypothetical protein